MNTLRRNIDAAGRVSWHASETEARHAARTELLRGAPPFRTIAEIVQVPTSRKRLAAFLNSLGA